MRLIDAEAFEKSVRTDFWEHYTNCHDTNQTDLLELIMDNLAEQPTIEAKPVVHAHWENTFCLITPYDEDDYEEARCKCSNCTMITDFEYDYCPYCGAQMDEVAGDINVESKTDEKEGE